MQFSTGIPGGAQVRFYFVNDDAPVFPGQHLWGMPTWDPEGPAQVGLGEVGPQFRIYDKGAPPVDTPLSPDTICGALDWWRNGVPFGTPPLQLNFQQLPICCYGGHVPPPCIPWNRHHPPPRPDPLDLTSATAWPAFTNTADQLDGIEPILGLDSVLFRDDLSHPCGAYFNTRAEIFIQSAGPPYAATLILVDYDVATNNSTWQVPSSAPAYAGDQFLLVSPLHPP
jgi:hypothetical protein